MSTTHRTPGTLPKVQPQIGPFLNLMNVPRPKARPAAKNIGPTEEAPVDMSRLRRLVADDPVEMRQLVDIYLQESTELLGKLRVAVELGEKADVAWVAHRLRGSSSTCGMNAVLAPLRELEESGKAGSWPQNLDLVNEADHQHGRIRAYLSLHARTA